MCLFSRCPLGKLQVGAFATSAVNFLPGEPIITDRAYLVGRAGGFAVTCIVAQCRFVFRCKISHFKQTGIHSPNAAPFLAWKTCSWHTSIVQCSRPPKRGNFSVPSPDYLRVYLQDENGQSEPVLIVIFRIFDRPNCQQFGRLQLVLALFALAFSYHVISFDFPTYHLERLNSALHVSPPFGREPCELRLCRC